MELNDFRNAVRADAIERAWENAVRADAIERASFTYGTGIEDGVEAAIDVALEFVTTALLSVLKSGIPE